MALNLSRETRVYLSKANGVHASGSGIKTASVTSGGTSGYKVGDVLVQSGTDGSGTGARFRVAAVSSGVVTHVFVPNNGRGSGHAASDVITCAAGGNTSIDSSTLVGDVTVTVGSIGGTTTVDGSRSALGLFKGNGTDANTFRVGVLDGYSFSQANTTTDVTINEAGATPNRGSKRFNDSLDAGEWSFQTYVRPYKHSANSWGTENDHDSVENFLWSGLAGTELEGINSGSGAAVTTNSTNFLVDFAESEVHELMKFQLYFVLENTTYRLNECQVNQAEVDFSIDGIGTITWSGNCTTIDQISDPIEDPNVVYSSNSSDSARSYSANASEDYAEAMNYVDVTGVDDADYIKNKLSTLSLVIDSAQGGGAAQGGLDAKTYSGVKITGGSITFTNNITYLTPETLGIVDKSIGSFTGSRQISGTLNMYLETGSTASNQLLQDLQASTDLVTNSFNMSLFMGGASAPYAEFDIPQAHLAIPTIEVADLISVSVEFAALGTAITDTDEATVKYVGSASHNDSTNYGADYSV